MTLLLLILLSNPITLMGVADLNADYPDVDMGVGIGYSIFEFRNAGRVRAGAYASADLNPDMSRPDWTSIGAFLSREIQVNVTIGAAFARRLGTPEGWQFGMFLGFDLWPWRTK